MLIYFFIYEIQEQIACEIFVIRDTMPIFGDKWIKYISLFIFRYFIQVKKNHEMIVQRRDVSVQVSLGRNCPDTDV